MIEEVVSVELPVHERLVVRKNRLMNEENGIDMPRISIVTGTHGDELDGQYICYEVIRRIDRLRRRLSERVDYALTVGIFNLHGRRIQKSSKNDCSSPRQG